jgi:ribosomal protein S18 acetylase RimI-like enzyme
MMKLKKVTPKEALEWINRHQTELEYSVQYLEGRLNTMNIFILLDDNGMEIGFVDSKTVQKEDLSSHDDAEFIQEALNDNQPYFYIETLNIRSTFQRKGYGKLLVEMLKEELTEPILVYVTADSFEFWYEQEFKGVNDDDYWLFWKKRITCKAIA